MNDTVIQIVFKGFQRFFEAAPKSTEEVKKEVFKLSDGVKKIFDATITSTNEKDKSSK